MKRSGFRQFVTFSDWLREQVYRHDGTGEFARAALADPKWPRKRTTLPAFTSYVDERDVHGASQQSLEVAWTEYEAATGAVEFRGNRRVR